MHSSYVTYYTNITYALIIRNISHMRSAYYHLKFHSGHFQAKCEELLSRLLLSSVCMCDRVYACPCVYASFVDQWIEIIQQFFTILKATKSHPTTYSAMLQLMTLTYFLKVKDSSRDHFGKLNVVLSHTMTNISNTTITNT